MESMLSGIILASGFSSRMKQDKLLLPIDGRPMVEWVVRAAVRSRLDECILVYRNTAVRDIGIKYGLRVTHNEQAGLGQSSSVKLGVSYAAHWACGFLFLVGDQPFVQPEIINTLIVRHGAQPEAILASTYGGRRGNPVLFPSSLRSELLVLTGDTGGRAIMARMPDRVVEVAFEDSLAGIDIDTPESYRSIASIMKAARS